MKYSVLIVDDEKPARELIKMKLDWSKLGFDLIDEARDGEEALELYAKKRHNIVVTDIQMPVMDGLQLIEKIKEINSDQPIVILSCHENFLFAKKAIRLGVEDYLIKDTFNVEELYSLISKIIKSDIVLGNDNSVTLNEDGQFDGHKDIVIKTLIFEGVKQELLPEYLDKYKLNLKSKQYILLYVDVDKKPKGQFSKDYLSKEEIRTVLQISRSIMNDDARGEVCFDEKNGFVCIYGIACGISLMNLLKEANSVANRIRTQIREKLERVVTIGISRCFYGLSSVKTAYDEAKLAAQRKIFMGSDRIFFYSNTASGDETHIIPLLNMKLKRIKSNLCEKNFEPIYGEVRDLFLQNLKGFMQYNYLKHTNWELISILMDFCSSNGIEFNEVSEVVGSPWETLMDKNTVEEMCSWFVELIKRVETRNKQGNQSEYSFYVGKSIKHIMKHFSEPIGLSNLADSFGISSAYLARIFKKETGQSITDFTTNLRVEEAKKLIMTTDKKLYEIAEETGFGSTQRFYLLFKKVVGVSPGEYRKA